MTELTNDYVSAMNYQIISEMNSFILGRAHFDFRNRPDELDEFISLYWYS
jgi:hypothetical protein